MAPRLGYLLPTRERVMEGRPQTGPLLDLAVRAEQLGFDSVWVGDSLLARPRHDPLTLLAAMAALLTLERETLVGERTRIINRMKSPPEGRPHAGGEKNVCYSAAPRRWENPCSWLVMNSSSAARPSSFWRRARRIASPICAGSSTRSLQPPRSRAILA